MSNEIQKSNRFLLKSDEVANLPILESNSENDSEADTSEDDSRSSPLYSSSAHSESDDVSPDPIIPRSSFPFRSPLEIPLRDPKSEAPVSVPLPLSKSPVLPKAPKPTPTLPAPISEVPKPRLFFGQTFQPSQPAKLAATSPANPSVASNPAESSSPSVPKPDPSIFDMIESSQSRGESAPAATNQPFDLNGWVSLGMHGSESEPSEKPDEFEENEGNETPSESVDSEGERGSAGMAGKGGSDAWADWAESNEPTQTEG